MLDIIILISVTVGGGSCATVEVWKRFDQRGLLSKWLECFSTTPVIVTDVSRDAFEQTECAEPKPVQGHTHATAAALRTAATTTARQYVAHMGVRLFVLEMAKSDQRKGLKGTRQWYWAKDTHTENRKDERKEDDVEYICDVDYYLDMPELLGSRAKPTLIYTVVPEEAVGKVDDTSFYFNDDGSLTTIVAGGGHYEHHLWDYASDSLIVEQKHWTGLLLATTTYAVERKQVGYSRQLILLSPIKRFTFPMSYLARWILEGQTLKRFDPVVTAQDSSKFIRFKVHRKAGTMVTVARPSTFACATIPADADTHLATVARLGSIKLQLPTTLSWLPESTRGDAVIMTEYHRVVAGAITPIVYPVEQGVRAYQYEPTSYDAELRPKITAFMSPIVHGAFAPVQGNASELRAIDGRIKALKAPEPKPMAFRDQCIEEFVDLCLNGAVLHPVDIETVIEKQTKPAQKQSIERATTRGNAPPSRMFKLFLKAEAYPDVKDPRIITMIPDSDKLDWSMFCLAMSEHLKQFPWYGPGKTPLQIATRVAEICVKAKEFVNLSDFTRMDGTITNALRMVDRRLYMQGFPSYRPPLNELLKRNVDNKIAFTSGNKADQGAAQASGAPGTSVDQTIRAAFCSYFAYRNVAQQCGKRLSPSECFSRLGLHFGDDGIDPDLPTVNHEWSARKCGLLLEAHTVQKGDRGVNFLARYYSQDVWYNAPHSMCDIKRQLSKIHVTHGLPQSIRNQDKLVEKCMSYLATDASTPILGAFCKTVIATGHKVKQHIGVGSWWSKFEQSEQYPNLNIGGWMDSEFEFQLPGFDRSLFESWLGQTHTIFTLLNPPICCEIKPPTPATVDFVVDGDVVRSNKPANKHPDNNPTPTDDEGGKQEEQGSETASATSSNPKRRQRTRKTKAIKEPTEQQQQQQPATQPKTRKTTSSKTKTAEVAQKAKINPTNKAPQYRAKVQ